MAFTEFPLTISINNNSKNINIHFGYQTEHFTQDLVKELAEHFKMALQGIIQNLAQSPWDINLLPYKEIEKIMYAVEQ